MGSYTHYACTLIVALAVSLRGTSGQLNMNHVCALVNNGLMIGSMEYCDTYYVCQNGKATHQQCASGYYFNKESQVCQPQDQVQCLAANAAPCSGFAVGQWAPVAGSCTDFYYCSLNGPERSTCPYGEYFNPTTQSCVYADQYNCMQAAPPSEPDTTGTNSAEDSTEESISVSLPINLCILIQAGIYFGSPSSCSGWNKCNNGVMISGICPNGLEYNVLTMSCDYASSVTCSQVTNDPYLTPNNCSTVNAMKAGPTCDSYMVCDGTSYQINHCPSGEYYDMVSQTCVDRLEARNNCDRCEGTTKTFVNMYSAYNCSGYLYCVNGVEVSSGYCTNGTYFNEEEGACVTGVSEPMFGCCNPQYYGASATTPTVGGNSTTAAGNSTTVATSTTESSVNATSDASSNANSNSTTAAVTVTTLAPTNGTDANSTSTTIG
ncbi:peritrophin-48 [Stomoxys calcitrans]|uniref:peritrophin-48 n=1 Tax=Stomoxys calcitrans TaxID=35570 RepID=UPI0027E2FABE|nr:peritrophin-48 [Stomoxys calcitrans]